MNGKRYLKGKHTLNPNDYFPKVHSNTHYKGSLYEYAYIAGLGTKRSRHKCVHYECESKWCKILKISCVGPSNVLCTHYATNSKEGIEANNCKTTISNSYSIIMIPVDKIVLDSKINIPTLTDVNNEKRFYMKNSRFTTPVLVSPQANRYILKDFAQVFFAARDLGISVIPCGIYTNE